MDIIAPVIIAALTKLGETGIKVAYDKLKTIIATKLGKTSQLVDAIENLEKKPDSKGRELTLREEVTAADVHRDEDILRAAEALLKKLNEQPGGQQLVQQTVTGDKNIFSGT